MGGTVSSLGTRLGHIPGGPETLPRQSLGGWPSTHLAKQANVVSARPVLDHLTVSDSPDVNVGPSHIGIRDPDTGQQGHRRCLMVAANGHVVGDEIAFGDEVVMLNGEVATEVGPDVLDDLLPPFSALARRTGSMVDHVLGDELIDRRIVAFRPATKQLFNHVLRLGRHRRRRYALRMGHVIAGSRTQLQIDLAIISVAAVRERGQDGCLGD